MKLKVILAAALILFVGSESKAEKLCLRTQQKINGNRVRLANVVRAETECPRRYIEILDTEEFRGPQGDAGIDGANGQNGSNGEDGTSLLLTPVIRSASAQVTRGASNTAWVHCEDGEVATGGGSGLTNGYQEDVSFWSSRPVDADGGSTETGSAAGWVASMQHLGRNANTYSFKVWVVCVPLTGAPVRH